MATKRKAPIRSCVLELTQEGYEGWKATVRTNPRWGLIEDLYEGQDLKLVRESLAQIVLDWDFVDEEGNPYPDPYGNTDVFRDLPTDLLEGLLRAYQERVTEVPNP